nr:MAG TPA: hypothetical protein [Caudoviricetes sp.]
MSFKIKKYPLERSLFRDGVKEKKKIICPYYSYLKE